MHDSVIHRDSEESRYVCKIMRRDAYLYGSMYLLYMYLEARKGLLDLYELSFDGKLP